MSNNPFSTVATIDEFLDIWLNEELLSDEMQRRLHGYYSNWQNMKSARLRYWYTKQLTEVQGTPRSCAGSGVGRSWLGHGPALYSAGCAEGLGPSAGGMGVSPVFGLITSSWPGRRTGGWSKGRRGPDAGDARRTSRQSPPRRFAVHGFARRNQAVTRAVAGSLPRTVCWLAVFRTNSRISQGLSDGLRRRAPGFVGRARDSRPSPLFSY